MTGKRRYVALRGKITPTSRESFGSAGFGGTVDRAHGRAEGEARDLDELERASQTAGGEHELASEVSERIRAIISSAEAAANAVRHEAEQRAAVKRRLADEEARRIVEDARRDAEAYLAERIRRISELSDAVVERGEGIVMRLDRAEEVRRQLQGLADALGESAEELTRELGGSAAAPDRRATPEAIAAEEPRAAAAPAATVEPAAAPATTGTSAATESAGTEAASGAATRDAASTTDASPAAAEPEASTSSEIADDPTIGELADTTSAEDEADRDGAEIVELVKGEPDERGPREPDEQLSARLVALQMAVAGGKRDEVETHLRRTFDLGDVGQILDDVFGEGAQSGKRAGWPSRGDGAA